MPRPDLRRAGTRAGTILLPIVVVQVIAWMSGAEGPRSSMAHPATGAPAVPDPPAVLEPLPDAAVARARELAATGVTRNPFFDPPRPGPDGDDVAQEVPSPPTEAGTPGRITGIMGGAGGATAIIEGRRCRVGERVSGTRWIITNIDAGRREVSFVDELTGAVSTRGLTAR